MPGKDDPEAVGEATRGHAIVRRMVRLPEVTFTMDLKDVNPEVLDLIMYGESPGPHIHLGEN